ncbi:MAG TPA: hypothetical protein VMW49_05020, partial [Candidatus Dormibacteraeota bacterium]|nr:hypothetical protein [Candidatus Dormibacteraeota bacterium]
MIERRGWVRGPLYEVTDSGYAPGATYSAALAQLRRDARAGQLDVLAIWSLDRLSRQGPLA